jgi:hypothetical protein
MVELLQVALSAFELLMVVPKELLGPCPSLLERILLKVAPV